MQFLNKKDLSQKVFGLENYIPGSESTKDLGIKISSGTTDAPIVIVIKGHVAEGKYVHCLEKNRFNAYMRFSTKRATYLNDANFMLRNTSVKRVLFLDRQDVQHLFFWERITEFAPSEMYTYVFHLNSLFDQLFEKRKNISPLVTIRFVGIGADLMTEELVKKIKKHMPHAFIVNDYGVAETDGSTTSCPYLKEKYPEERFRVFHPWSFFVFDIIEKDENGIGEIVITSPELKNYRTGDLGKIIFERCKCGFKKTLLYKGRLNYDIAYCAGATFVVTLIDRIFKDFASMIDDYRVEVREDMSSSMPKGSVRILFVPLKNFTLKEVEKIKRDLCTAITKRLFVTKTRTLGDLVREGIFSEPSVEMAKTLNQTIKKIHLIKKE